MPAQNVMAAYQQHAKNHPFAGLRDRFLVAVAHGLLKLTSRPCRNMYDEVLAKGTTAVMPDNLANPPFTEPV